MITHMSTRQTRREREHSHMSTTHVVTSLSNATHNTNANANANATNIATRDANATQLHDATNANATKIASLLSQLNVARDARDVKLQKSLRRQLRALNHFGGSRITSSRYCDVNATHVALRIDAINMRAQRIAQRFNVVDDDATNAI